MNTIRRLAILNRGEPAMRALDAVAELNRDGSGSRITSIIVHTDPDVRSWFVRSADEAVSLGPATTLDPADGSRRSAYLDEERVVAALLAARADAVWVGWGFLAEQASFAQRCEEAGIIFVGPDSETIRMLGDKVAAKALAEKVGVPVVPWSGGMVTGIEDAAEHAARIGFPLVVKAAAGGGGRGIRLVAGPADLAGALASAQAEAALAFGDPSVFLERYVERARHVEVQIIADGQGTTWALGVRDCSAQRRHQKVIEESASTVLDGAAEQAIKEAAVRIVDAAGYRSAGTVEFLVHPGTGHAQFMEVNTRLQVEHPVTEMTCGADLVKLQLHIAAGGRLEGRPPPSRGHAVEARLCAEDPEQDFAPAPGLIALWRAPAGPGIRVDAGVAEGDRVAPEFDSLIAKVIAWGRDRDEALARLRRALGRAVAVVAGGTTNRSFLLSLLDSEDLRRGEIDTRWLDRLMATGGHLPPAEPLAVLMAAVEAYDRDEAAARAAFHAGARRGRPEAPQTSGHRVRLRYRGGTYRLAVYRTGPEDYLVRTGGAAVPMRIDRLGEYERRAVVAGRTHQVVAQEQRSSFVLDIDGRTHRVHRDDGGVVRAAAPAFVIAVLVKPGDQVAAGDPLVVLESMKMASTVSAPFPGEVVDIAATVNTQVDQAAPLLRIREAALPAATGSAAGADLLDFAALAASPDPAGQDGLACLAALHAYLMGFDQDPATVAAALDRQRRSAGSADPAVLAAEDRLLDLFADVSALYRPQPDPSQDGLDTSAQEHVLSYLQWQDADRAGLPEPFRAQLRQMLGRYGVDGLEPTPALDEAVVWMWRSFQRADEVAAAVTTVLERRLHDRVLLAERAGAGWRSLFGRLAVAGQARYPQVADLARDVIFGYFDEPLLERRVAGVYAAMAADLDALQADPERADAAALVQRLVHSPQPMRGSLLHRWAGASAAFRRLLLEVHLRRFYRIRPLHDVRFTERDGLPLGAADYEHEGKRVHVVAAYAPLAELPRLAGAVAGHLAGIDATRKVVLELVVWRPEGIQDAAQMAGQMHRLLAGCDFGRPLHRLDVTVTSGGTEAEHGRTQHFVFRQQGGEFTEELLYRNLHTMIGKRLELWRLSNFELERLLSVEDVYLFRGVARDNPADVRLFALAEVRDLTPVRDGAGRVVALPLLERMGLQALAAMRQALADLPPRKRPQANRIVLYLRPPLAVPHEQWRDLARPYLGLAAGAGLQKIQLRVRIPAGGAGADPGGAPAGPPGTPAAGLREAVLEFDGSADDGEVRMRERPPAQQPIRSQTGYRQRVARAARLGAPYPYEIVRMLTPERDVASDFPPGEFVEHDLDAAHNLVPVDRPYGENTANLVVGVITSRTPKFPDGMSRVAILGDPTRRLGALAEPECRRIAAALDLAEGMRVPVEWFALSSGARIAMDSGTENMDWVGAVLRRLIEFTQGGGEVNVVVTGINVGAQPYWNAEATMLMHTRGILVMMPSSAMVLTGKQALDFSGGVSAEDNLGIGGFERVMGPNGQGQYWAPNLQEACQVLMRHYEHTYIAPGEAAPRRRPSTDPVDRDVRTAPHHPVAGSDFTVVGDVFSAERNAERKLPFDIRSVMRAVTDTDAEPLERWARWRGAESAVVWDAHVGGIPVCLLGLESRTLARRGYLPADGPAAWTSGTLFPQSSRKVARAINAASGNRPVVVLANLSGFDGSPESMRRWQLEYGAEIGRAVTNFRGPIVFVVVSRYHGGAFVVFSKRLNERLEIAAVEGSYASVIGGAPAAGVVFVREVEARTDRDPRVVALRERLAAGDAAGARAALAETRTAVRAEKLGEVAAEFDGIHNIQRAQAMGSVDRIIPARELRPYIIGALERAAAQPDRAAVDRAQPDRAVDRAAVDRAAVDRPPAG
jgi:acetyl/propionyl-CoA carboxylase alpha subunit/acetyl-CoA carboxylase carboxyltransferase component